RALRSHEAREEGAVRPRRAGGPAEHAKLQQLHTRLQSPEPDTRRAAYEALPQVVAAVLDSARPEVRATVREQLHAYVTHAVRVERAAVDRAEARA
ncbi:hypothetical protein ACLESD_53740, partial [Pyxidicoccus sp. 3LFB2]